MTLHTLSRSGVSLADTLATGLADGSTGLLASAERFVVGRVAVGRCVDDTNREIDLASAFDARCFTPDRELRWHADPDGGRAVVLAESPLAHPGWSSGEVAARLLPGNEFPGYLVWGKVTEPGNGDGWVTCRSGRIGLALRLPVPGARRGDLVRLTAVEYVAKDRHGNVSVVEERLTGFSPRPGGPGHE